MTEVSDYEKIRTILDIFQTPVEEIESGIKDKYPTFISGGKRFVFDGHGRLFNIILKDGTVVTGD